MTLYVRATEFLPDERLLELSKCDALEHVSSLQFSVDTSENSLSDLGHRLPALTQLRLDGSNIATLRDLGTGLGGLRVLWRVFPRSAALGGFERLRVLQRHRAHFQPSIFYARRACVQSSKKLNFPFARWTRTALRMAAKKRFS